MADSNILSDFGINILEEEIDDVIFQTNEFLTDATFTGSQGPFWWLVHFSRFYHCKLLIFSDITKSCIVIQIPDGTKTGQNHRKIKSRRSLPDIPCREYPFTTQRYAFVP